MIRRDADAGSLAVPGRPILSLEEGGGYQLHLSVPEGLLGSLRVGQQLSIEIDALHPQGPVDGPVQEIVPVVDVRSRTSVVKVDLPSLPALRSGLFGRTFLKGKIRTVAVAPPESIREEGQIRSVFVVEEGIARQRLVTLGVRLNGGYEVLSGAAPGERVVLAPQDLRDGARVVTTERTAGKAEPERIDSPHKENPDG